MSSLNSVDPSVALQSHNSSQKREKENTGNSIEYFLLYVCAQFNARDIWLFSLLTQTTWRSNIGAAFSSIAKAQFLSERGWWEDTNTVKLTDAAESFRKGKRNK